MPDGQWVWHKWIMRCAIPQIEMEPDMYKFQYAGHCNPVAYDIKPTCKLINIIPNKPITPVKSST